MNLLDIRTVLISYVISNAICAIVMFYMWLNNHKHSPMIGYWLADFIMQFLAIFLILLRPSIPLFFSIILANAFVIGGTILLFNGLEKFLWKTSSRYPNYILLGFFLIVHIYFTYINNNLQARNINGSLALLIICAQCSWLLLHRVDMESKQVARLPGTIFLVYCVVILSRIIVDSTSPQSNDLFKSGLYDTLVLLAYQMLFIFLTFSLFLMVNRRLFNELEQDIVQRKIAQEGLKASEEKFSSAFQNSPDAVIISTLETGKIIEVNDRFFQLSQLTREETIDKTTIELNVWENTIDRVKYVENLKKNSRVSNFETVFRNKSGGLFPCWISSEVVVISNAKYVISVIHDLTEKKEADEKVRNLIRFPEENPSPVLRIDGTGKILYANPASKEIINYWQSLYSDGVPVFWGNSINEASTMHHTVEIVEDFNGKTFSFILSPSPNAGVLNVYGRDVSEKIKDNRELEIERNKLKNILDRMNDGVYIVNKEYDIEYVNPVFIKEFGNPGNKKCYEYFNDLENPCSWCKNSDVFDGKTIQWEWISPKDGKIFSIFETPINNLDGTTSKLAVFHDITELKKAEQDLSESEGKFKYIFDHSNIGNSITLPNGEIHVNKAFVDMIGYSEEELQGKKWQDITHPDDITLTQVEMNALTAGEKEIARFVKRYIRKDGSILWIDLSTSIRRDEAGNPMYLMTSLMDITERIMMVETLQKNEARLRAVLDSTPFPVAMVDVEDNIIHYWSRSALALFGHTAPTAAEWYQLAYPDPNYRQSVIDRWKIFLEEARQSLQPVNTGEYEVTCKDGSVRICELYAAFLGDYLIVTFNDITEKKNVEDEILQLNKSLEEKVELRTHQLTAANKELESFSYSVSHDLRAPLRALDGFSLAILEDYSDKLDGNGRKYLNRIREASQRMANLIDAMLTLSRVTKTEINSSQVNLSEIAAIISVDLRKLNPKRKVSWKIQPGIIVKADPVLIKNVMENLLFNAWKFTSKHPSAIIEVGTVHNNGEVIYFVRDDGAGFDMNYASKLFGAFQRMHSTAEFDGTGIGLATVQRIITKHGGRIWAEGKPEGGATFYFTLNNV
jgi:PAS domain S-box-containing protein